MRSTSSRLAPWILALGCGAAASSRAQVTQADRDQMVAAHNVARAAAAPYAVPPLAGVTYNASFETGDPKAAQTWANGCVFQHSFRPGFGENLYALCSSGIPPRPPAALAVANWDSEGAYYNYVTDSCSAPPFPGTCGHHTQVVWRSSTSIGCGIAQCNTNSPCGVGFPNWYFWVCQYSPAGNVVGQRAYLCDYDANPGTPQTLCTNAPVAVYLDGFEIGVERWSGKNPP